MFKLDEAPVQLDARRGLSRDDVGLGKGKTISRRYLTADERALAKITGSYPRPRTRSDCEAGPRPCPYVGCRYHLYLTVQDGGNLKINFPYLRVDELEQSCTLDLAAEGGMTMEAVGEALNLTRERVRQIEVTALEKARKRAESLK